MSYNKPMQLLVVSALTALGLGFFRAGPADPFWAVVYAAGVLAVGAAAQSIASRVRRDRLREQYRAALQQYAREFGESEFYVAMLAANGRGLAAEGRHFQRPSGFDRHLDLEGDLSDRRRWGKEATLMGIVGELEDLDDSRAFVNGMVLLVAASAFMGYRFMTPPQAEGQFMDCPACAAATGAATPVAPAPVTPAVAAETTATAAAAETPAAETAPAEAPAAVPAVLRFALERCGSVYDAQTRLRWFVGPDQTFLRDDAERYVTGLHQCDRAWRLPSSAELDALFDPALSAGEGSEIEGFHVVAHVSPMFSNLGRGIWAWMADENGRNAYDLSTGVPLQLRSDPGTRAVRIMAVSP